MRPRPDIFLVLLIFSCLCLSASVADAQIPRVTIGLEGADNPQEVSATLQVLFLLTLLALAPALLVMVTSFTRTVIVLSFIRQALGTQQVPSNQIIVGLALFLTFFIMTPVGKQINEQALQPYLDEQITSSEALGKAMLPLRQFMRENTRENDLGLFVAMTEGTRPANFSEVSTLTLIPAFVISELRTAFIAAFIVYVPFLIIDVVVASTLLSMGMLMLPPIMISLPFKLLLFIAVDGWHLITRALLLGYVHS